MQNGYVKLYRSLKEKGYYKDSHYVHLWNHLLLSASYVEKEYLFNGTIYHLQPGEFITGRKILSNDTGIQESKIERILKCFENEQQIKQQTFNKYRIISICNWEKYQIIEQQNEQPVNNQRTTSEQQVNTIKNIKNIKKDNNKVVSLPDWLSPEDWKDFKDHRNKIRKPMTLRAEEILIGKLGHLKEQGHNPRHLLITAIERGWQTVYEPK